MISGERCHWCDIPLTVWERYECWHCASQRWDGDENFVWWPPLSGERNEHGEIAE